MTNVRDSDISLWLHNKLGTSNDSWISGSICSQLNKEVLRNIKDCFPDLQTQVKLKLLLSFFHIPRRIVEEWKTELEEVIEVAGLDSELWVSMIAETIKTLPMSGSLNTEISDYEETRPIFTDMVNELKRLIVKNSDLGMLPLECQYLNKAALVSVVGQQSTPIKHFTLKRKPKSANLRADLLQKSSDAQSCLKKISAPTVPLRSRGIPRKMTDTTPLKGIPSRVPTGGFRSPPSSVGPNRPSMSRTPAGRKDGGIKLLEITEQPLGYAAAKKRKRQQELEEQQKKALETQSSPTSEVKPVIADIKIPTTTTPDYAAGLTASSVYSQPATPLPATSNIKGAVILSSVDIKPDIKQEIVVPANPTTPMTPLTPIIVKQEVLQETFKVENLSPTIATTPLLRSVSLISTQPLPTLTTSTPALTPTSLTSLPPNIQIIQSTSGKSAITTTSNNKIEILSSKTIQPATSSMQKQTILNQGGNIIFTTKPFNSVTTTTAAHTILQQQKPVTSYVLNSSPGKQINIQRVLAGGTAATSLPTLTTTISRAQHQQQLLQQQQQQQQQSQPTNIVQIKTAPTVVLNNSQQQQQLMQNIPPLISTQQHSTQPTILNIQTVQQPQQQQQQSQPRKTYTITAQNSQNSNLIATSVAQILQQHQLQQQQQQQQQQTIQSTSILSTASQQQPKYTQVMMSPNVKGKTITFLANSNMLAQKGVILRTVGSSGNTVYQQIPIGNVSGLSNLSGTTILSSGGGPPGLIKTEPQDNKINQIPALVPTSSLHQNIPALTPVVIQQSSNQQHQQTQHSTIPALITNITQQQQQQKLNSQQQQQQQPQTMTIIRPVSSSNVQGVNMLPQGLTLIQRPGQQPQFIQTIQTTQQQQQQQPQLQRTIITQIPQQQQQQQQQQQTIQVQQHQPQNTGATLQIQQIQPAVVNQQQQPTGAAAETTLRRRKGLTLSDKHMIEAHDMFKRANRVTRLDKALILGFMTGYRDNPRPNPENVVTIKLNESKERMKQEDDTDALMLVESLITLDYNTGEWKTFRKFRKLGSSQQILENNSQTLTSPTQNSVVI